MTADIKSEKFFLVGKFFVIAPAHDHPFSGGGGVSFIIEQRNLSDRSVTQRGSRARKRFVDAGEKFRAIPADKIERAGLDQALQHFAVGNARTDSSAKIFQRS